VDVPDLEIAGDEDADLLVIGWGSSFGAIRAGVRRARESGVRVAVTHFHHLNPLPANTGEVLRRYERVLLPEMNAGQLAKVLRAEFLVDVESFTKVKGQPLFASEIEQEILHRV
jgi:2-oxoglutarate ferredoxin oxidoreductase subunit alpha